MTIGESLQFGRAGLPGIPYPRPPRMGIIARKTELVSDAP